MQYLALEFLVNIYCFGPPCSQTIDLIDRKYRNGLSKYACNLMLIKKYGKILQC